MLCSLNLTAASRVYIMEPQWNPTVERQAIGRTVRLGQQKQVVVVRYIVRNTVEEVKCPYKRNENIMTDTRTVKYIQNRQQSKMHLASIGWEDNCDNSIDGKLKRL